MTVTPSSAEPASSRARREGRRPAAREELADEAVGEVALELGADGVSTRIPLASADGAQQRRLALAGGRLDHGDRRRTVARGGEQRAEIIELLFALQKLGVGDVIMR